MLLGKMERPREQGGVMCDVADILSEISKPADAGRFEKHPKP